jgi:hypothetical protein
MVEPLFLLFAFAGLLMVVLLLSVCVWIIVGGTYVLICQFFARKTQDGDPHLQILKHQLAMACLKKLKLMQESKNTGLPVDEKALAQVNERIRSLEKEIADYRPK